MVGALSAVLLLPAARVAIFATVIFDAPGSESIAFNWFAYTGLCAAPFLLIVAIVLSAVGFWKADHRRVIQAVSALAARFCLSEGCGCPSTQPDQIRVE